LSSDGTVRGWGERDGDFEARKTRTGRIVAVGDPIAIAGALGETVDLIAPDSSAAATARLTGVGRTWTDPHTGTERAYGYLDPASIQATVGAA
jgi:hypothetical protein